MINTALDEGESEHVTSRRCQIAGVEVLELLLPRATSVRAVGKLFNLFQIGMVTEYLIRLGRPKLIWLYNGYAFESCFGRYMATNYGCPVILEFEDWHFSRARGLNPKPLIDWLCWRAIRTKISYAFSVNSSLADRMGGVGAKVGLLPGVVADGVAQLASSTPFISDDHVTVGYFGGLSTEKGADQVASLVRSLPTGFRVIATGSGELESEFAALAQSHGDRLSFFGRVDDGTLLELIGSCDVVLNPHTPIEGMGSGVFPFKVIEGIASGRLVISTPLPSRGLEDVLQGVKFISHDFGELLSAVVNSKAIYSGSVKRVRAGALEADRLFSKTAILAVINQVCSENMA